MNENIATYTPNIMLKKPGKKQRYDIGVFNANCDKIDKAVGENKKLANGKEDKGVATQLVEQLRGEKEDKGVAKSLDTALKTEILSEVLGGKDFPNLMQENGWAKLPNGLIMQWGKSRSRDYYSDNDRNHWISDGRLITFPIEFPNQGLILLATLNDHGSTGNAGDTYTKILSTTEALVWRDRDNQNSPWQFNFWFAIGY